MVGVGYSPEEHLQLLICIFYSWNPWRSKSEPLWRVRFQARNLFISVQFSYSVVSNFLRPHESQHTRPSCPSPTPGVYSNSCPLSWWCYSAISSSVVPFSSCPQPLPASGTFPMSQLVASGGQSTGVSASASVLPMNIQDWFPLGWTGWISLQSKGLSSVFSNTTVQSINFLANLLGKPKWKQKGVNKTRSQISKF